MNQPSKARLRDWLPPAIVRRVRQFRGMGNRFEGDYSSWDEANAHCSGYDAGEILDKILAATLKVKCGEAVYERDSVVFDQIEYFWPVTSGLMWVAARNNGRLNVLDFGGSLGSSYFQNRKFLKALSHVSWNVVEQPHYVDAGQLHIQSEELRFFKTIEECLADNQPNVVMLSSVLQYLEDPGEIIKCLTAAKATCLIVDRTPFTILKQDKILVQKVPASIYSASYPMWVFSMEKYLRLLESDWHLITQWQNTEGSVISTAGLEFSFQGMLLELRQ